MGMADPTAEEEVRQQKQTTAAARAALPDAPPTLPKPGDPGFTGPVLPGPNPLVPTVLRGRARFEAMVNQMGAGFASGVWGHDFNAWVMGLKEDPNDAEFNQVLAWAKSNAKRHEQGLQAAITNQKDKTAKQKKIDATTWKVPDNLGDPSAVSGLGTGQVPGIGPSAQSASVNDALAEKAKGTPTKKQQQIMKHEWEQERALWQQDTFKGRPMETGEAQEQAQDPWLMEWLKKEGIVLQGDNKTVALRSGEYVYMGGEYSAEYDATRGVYMYADDAKNAIATIDPGVIANWQKQLGIEATGKIDPDVSKFWDYAVAQASRYAATGSKVSVRDLMDIYVASAAAERNRGGGGGGGGGAGGLEEDPEDQAAVDYYRAMMAILGDISGVPNAQA